MRISDWSSDVCSSDLRIGIAGTNVIEEGHRRRYAKLFSLVSTPTTATICRIAWAINSDLGRSRPSICRSLVKIGRAHVCTPVTNAHLVCRLLLEQQKIHTFSHV